MYMFLPIGSFSRMSSRLVARAHAPPPCAQVARAWHQDAFAGCRPRTGRCDEAKLEKALRDVMGLSPRGIRQHLKLNNPIYERTAAYGHFGREPEADGGFSWERTDLVEALKKAI